jgi:large subunit ribosomal protein L23
MVERNPYHIIKHKHVTEKALVLQQLKNAKSNPSLAACESPKYVFIVDKTANKREIANALEEIYKELNIKVVAVNTINVRPKPRRVRGRMGTKAAFKKAIVTLEPKDNLDTV